MEKYYIVYFNKITQYHKTNKGYYVGYKDKIEDNYSENFIYAKRYKTLGAAITRTGLKHNGSRAVKLIESLENGDDIFENISNIEIISIPNERKLKLSKLNGENCDRIEKLGKISNDELIKYFRKEADRFLKSLEGKYYNVALDTKSATEEDIDDWCSHMDKILS